MSTEKKASIAHRLYTGQLSYDFNGHRKLWFIVSGVIIGISLLLLPFQGLNLGIEFRGGTDFTVPMTVTDSTVDKVRAEMDGSEVKDLGTQVFSVGETNIRVQTRVLTTEETSIVRAEVAEIADTDIDSVTYNAIGASWGKSISQQGAIALVVFLVLVMLMIAIYFRDVKMSVAAIVAVLHDLLVTVGVYAALGFTVTPSTVIGVLTILGYSLYDTVVVFDKIRENIVGLEKTNKTYSEQANLAVNQVLVRSINTTIIGVLPVAALFVAGAMLQSGPLADLGLALLVGMIAGAYSSIFIAAPLLAWLREREPGMVAHREQIERRKKRHEAKAEVKASHHRETVAATATTSPTGTTPSDAQARQQRRTASSRADRKKHK